MTREEAIEELTEINFNSIHEKTILATNMAIEALKTEPCDDCISRQDALDAMYALCNADETLKDNPWRDNPHIDAITDAIEDLPSVSPQQKGGRWIRVDYDSNPNIGNWHCSLCQNISKLSNYCPNCGAKMEVE